MRTRLAVLACAASLASAAFAQQRYTWTISNSSTDPFATTAPFVPGFLTLYLWMACSDTAALPGGGGVLGAEFGVTSSNPANVIISFTAAPGWTNLRSTTDLLVLNPTCPTGPVLAGTFSILPTAAGQYCIEPSPTTGNELTVDCDSTPHEFAFEGFSNNGASPCTNRSVLCPVPVTLLSFSIE